MYSPGLLMASRVLQQQDDGLTFREVLESLPTDPASLIAIVLLGGFIALVVYFGARGGGGPAKG
jgi:hypothetical protein